MPSDWSSYPAAVIEGVKALIRARQAADSERKDHEALMEKAEEDRRKEARPVV